MRVAIIQQANTDNAANNKKRLRNKILALGKQGAELVVLQELHNGLYFCQTEDIAVFEQAETIPGASTEFFGEVAREAGVVIVTSLFEKRAAGLYHNTSAVIERDGSVAGIYRKMHIPDDPAYYEKFYFAPGDTGFQPINTSVGRLGVLICWDQWYPEAARLMAMAGAEVLIYPTAIGWTPNDGDDEKQRQLDAWITAQRAHAVANGLHVITVNRTGYEASPQPDAFGDGITFWGNSFVCGAQGEILYKAPADSEVEQIIDIDLSRTETVRRWWPFFRDRRIDDYSDLTKRWRE